MDLKGSCEANQVGSSISVFAANHHCQRRAKTRGRRLVQTYNDYRVAAVPEEMGA